MSSFDLDAQLTGGHDDEGQRTRVAGVFPAGGRDLLQGRDAEREGLAGAGTRLTDDVGARKHDRQRQGLDRERVDDARLGEGGDDRLADAEGREVRRGLDDVVDGDLSGDRQLGIGRDLLGGDVTRVTDGVGGEGKIFGLIAQRRLLPLRTAAVGGAAHMSTGEWPRMAEGRIRDANRTNARFPT